MNEIPGPPPQETTIGHIRRAVLNVAGRISGKISTIPVIGNAFHELQLRVHHGSKVNVENPTDPTVQLLNTVAKDAIKKYIEEHPRTDK